MSKRPRPVAYYRGLMGRVWAELGAGRIREAFIRDDPKFATDGFCDFGTKRITVNVVHSTVDTIVHELIHRLFPSWPEPYVRRITTILLRDMSDDERVAFYQEYSRRVSKRRKPVDVRGAE